MSDQSDHAVPGTAWSPIVQRIIPFFLRFTTVETQYLFLLLPTKVWSSSISVISGISSSWGSSDKHSLAAWIQFKIVTWLIFVTLEIPLIPMPLRYISIQVCLICGEYVLEQGWARYWVPHFLHRYDCFPRGKPFIFLALRWLTLGTLHSSKLPIRTALF